MTPFVCLVNNLQPVISIDILQLFKREASAIALVCRPTGIIYCFLYTSLLVSMEPISNKFIAVALNASVLRYTVNTNCAYNAYVANDASHEV